MCGTNLYDGLFAYLLKACELPREWKRSSQSGIREIQQVRDQPLHSLRTVDDSRRDTKSSFWIVLGHRQEGRAGRDGAKWRAQIVPEHADKLIAKPVSLTGEPIHRLGHRFIDRLVESAYIGEIGLPAVFIEAQHGCPKCAKLRENRPKREAEVDAVIRVKSSRRFHDPRGAAAARLQGLFFGCLRSAD